MREHFAVRLFVEFFQCQVGAFEGFALGAEGGVAQTRAALFKSRPLAEALAAATALGTVVTARFKFVFHPGARAGVGLAARAGVLAVTELATAAGR